MSDFNEKEYIEYDLENFAVREKTTEPTQLVNSNTPKRFNHSAKVNLNLKKILLFSVPALILVVAIIIVIVVLVKPDEIKNKYFGYIKDGEVFLTTVENGIGVQITDDFITDDAITNTSISDFTRMNNEGTKIFYLDRYDGSSRNLYYREVSGENTSAHKLSSDVDYYDIDDAGTIVTYIKDDVDLFQHNLSIQSDKIDTGVSYFISSDDGTKILYYKENSDKGKDLYLFEQGQKSECIVKNVEAVRYISDNFSTIYYLSNSVLYKLTVGESPKEISKDVNDVIGIYASGDIYFSKIDNQAKAALYYYNGNETKKVVENYYRTECISTEKSALVVNCVETNSITYAVVVGSKVNKINHSVVSVAMNKDGSEIHVLANTNSQTMLGSLYQAKIGNELGELKKVADGVAYGKYINDSLYVYVKDYDVEHATGTLYAFGKKIGEDISWNSVLYDQAADSLYYFTNKKDNNGDLNCYKSGKASKVKENVKIDSLTINQNNDVLFLHDFKNGEGILFAIQEGKTVQVDHDVSKILIIVTNEEYDLLAKSYF